MAENLCVQEVIRFLTQWCFPKGSPFLHIPPPLTKILESGDDKPPTSIHGPHSRHFSQIQLWTNDSGRYCSQRGIHSSSTKHIQCTATPFIISSQGYRIFKYYRPGNAGAELLAGSTGTSQCIPYPLQISGQGTIFTDNCDDELHSGTTQYFVIGFNKPKKYQQ